MLPCKLPWTIYISLMRCYIDEDFNLQVAIPIDQFYGSHLRFIYKHRSSNDGEC